MRRALAIGLAAVAVAASATGAGAQASWTVGFKAGPGIASIGGDDAGEADARVGFVGGMFAQADLSPGFGVRIEGLYFAKGASDDSPNLDTSFKLDYLSFPVLLVGRAAASDDVTLSAFAGPTLAFNVGAEAELDFGPIVVRGDIGDVVADFEFGLVFGAGAAIQTGNVVVVLDGRFDLGLTSLDDGLDPDQSLDLKNHAWAFLVGVGFPIGK